MSTRLHVSATLPTAHLWDERNRMTVIYQGDPAVDGRPSERYLYDEQGYRVVVFPESGDGLPRIAVRDGEGQLLADYVQRSQDTHPTLARDYLYAAGQLLVERHQVEAVQSFSANSPLEQSGSYTFTVDDPTAHPSYTLDVRTHTGMVSRTEGLVPDGAGVLSLPESAFAANETNFVRLRPDGDGPQAYTAPVAVTIDPSVTESSTHPVRSIALARTGTDLVIRWQADEASSSTV